MSCPFLSKFPTGFLAQYAPLLRPFSSKCPVMSTAPFRSYSSTYPSDGTSGVQGTGSEDATHCPFLESMKVTITAVQEEEATREQQVQGSESQPVTGFRYEQFFQEQIWKKKLDHSYRVFKRVARTAAHPPFAQNLASAGQDITVWCSNDYLGMTAHPRVRAAVM